MQKQTGFSLVQVLIAAGFVVLIALGIGLYAGSSLQEGRNFDDRDIHEEDDSDTSTTPIDRPKEDIEKGEGVPPKNNPPITNSPKTENATTLENYFNNTLQNGAIDRVGQPIEGFVPSMFQEAFPGLVDSDFNNVEASLGMYTVVDGELTFELDDSGPIHSAADAITTDGMAMLLDNVKKRTGLLIMTTDDIDTLIILLEGNSDAGETTTAILCTPESKRADVCTLEYAPVCGLVEVQCITTPCNPVPETFGNACSACARGNVISYTVGACSP